MFVGSDNAPASSDAPGSGAVERGPSGSEQQCDTAEAAALAATWGPATVGGGFMGADLAFEDNALEAAYCLEQASKQWPYDMMLAVLVRLPGWTATALKLAARGQAPRAAFIWLTCTATALLPPAAFLANKQFHLRRRPLLQAACNTLQYLQSCWYYADLYYFRGTADTVGWGQMATALLSANGVAYLLLTTFAGALTFRWAFLTQYAYLVILLVYNQQLCAASPALQAAYRMLDRSALRPIADALATRAAALGFQRWPSAVPAARQLLQHQCPAGAGKDWAGAADCARRHQLQAEADLVRMCVHWQANVQMLLGVALPCLLLFVREIKHRRDFVNRRPQAGGGNGRIPPLLAHHLLPSPLDYLVFAVPALLFGWQLLAFPTIDSHHA